MGKFQDHHLMICWARLTPLKFESAEAMRMIFGSAGVDIKKETLFFSCSTVLLPL